MQAPTPTSRDTAAALPPRNKRPIRVTTMTKYHTPTGSILYHLVFSNHKEHLTKASDILTWISPRTLQFYEHRLRTDLSPMRTHLQERVGHVNDRAIAADTLFPPFRLPPLCVWHACVVCRNETGYLNFSNGEADKWTRINCMRLGGCGVVSDALML